MDHSVLIQLPKLQLSEKVDGYSPTQPGQVSYNICIAVHPQQILLWSKVATGNSFTHNACHAGLL